MRCFGWLLEGLCSPNQRLKLGAQWRDKNLVGCSFCLLVISTSTHGEKGQAGIVLACYCPPFFKTTGEVREPCLNQHPTFKQCVKSTLQGQIHASGIYLLVGSSGHSSKWAFQLAIQSPGRCSGSMSGQRSRPLTRADSIASSTMISSMKRR